MKTAPVKTCRDGSFKMVEFRMVTLASLALQSAKKLFQKGNLENKHVTLTLSGADVHAHEVLVLIPTRIGDFTDFFQDISLDNET